MGDIRPQQEVPSQGYSSGGTTRPKPDRNSGGYRRGRVFRRKDAHPNTVLDGHNQEYDGRHGNDREKELPRYNDAGHRVNHNGHVVHPWVQPDGESGRRGFHPWHFLRICFRSSSTASKWTNLLWPFTVAALVLHFGFREHDLWIFITSYIGMVPAANLVGFGGQELARKIPKVAGVILETTFGSIVEIILFVVLIAGPDSNIPVIRAAILGSILANLLFCLGTVLSRFSFEYVR
jgi:Ca2+:H+ antiporter